MSVTGTETTQTIPPKIARQLKVQIEELFHRYAFEDVINEIGRQRPEYDIHITTAETKKRKARG